MKKKNRIAVIGGGVSGMTAAVTAAEQGADVLLLEQKEMTGKKILVTGERKMQLYEPGADTAVLPFR